jgi:Acyl-CoA dehydrogenases
MQTRAVDSGDHFVINGRKLWITNGKEAEIFVLFANANPEAGYRGITAFIVERVLKDSLSARKKTSSAFAHRRPPS